MPLLLIILIPIGLGVFIATGIGIAVLMLAGLVLAVALAIRFWLPLAAVVLALGVLALFLATDSPTFTTFSAIVATMIGITTFVDFKGYVVSENMMRVYNVITVSSLTTLFHLCFDVAGFESFVLALFCALPANLYWLVKYADKQPQKQN